MATATVELTRTSVRSRIYGFGTLYGKTMRDSRLAFLIAAGLLGGLSLAMGAAISTVFPTPEARHEVDKLIGGIPAQMVNFFGKPVGLGTLGGYLTWKYGLTFIVATSLWSILALSSTLAGEAQPREPGSHRDHAVRQAPHCDREGRRTPHRAGARPGVHGGHDHAQLEHLRGSGARRSHPPARGDRLRAVARLHRALLRRPGVRARATARPGRRGRRLRDRARGALDGARARCGTAGRAQPVPVDGEPHPARRPVRLAGSGARRSRRSRLHRDRRRAVRPPRSRGHARHRAAVAAGGRPGRARPDQPGIRRAAPAVRLVGPRARDHGRPPRVARRPDGGPALRRHEPPEGPPAGLPRLRPHVGGGVPAGLRRAVLHRRRVRRRDAGLEVGVGRERRPPRGSPDHATDACALAGQRRDRRLHRRRDRDRHLCARRRRRLGLGRIDGGNGAARFGLARACTWRP